MIPQIPKLRGFRQIGQVIAVALALLSLSGFALAQDESQILSRIAFGSCAKQTDPCPIWETIADYQPELTLLLGDNVYADILDGRMKPATPQRIADAYATLAKDPGFARLRNSSPIMAVWDDHDYGNNDSGVEWEHKRPSAELFHDFFGTPADSPLRKQAGVYQARIFGPPGKRVQIILLDTRFFRSPLEKGTAPLPGFRALPYVPNTKPDATILGEAQWKWLEEQLLLPAEVRLIGSSIQVVSSEHPFEKWDNFPLERSRLFELIQRTAASGVVILSGDRHLGEISLEPSAVGYPLYDITASGLNQATQGWREVEPNRFRVAALPYGNHFGSVEIDWSAAVPLIKLQLRHEDGEIAVQARVPLDVLTAGPPALPRPAGVLSAAEVLHVDEGEAVQVQFAIRGARAVSGDRWLLNSEVDFRNSRNFTAVLNRGGRSSLPPNAGPDSLIGKTIRVTGNISLYNGSKQIQIDTESQWEIVSESSADDSEK